MKAYKEYIEKSFDNTEDLFEYLNSDEEPKELIRCKDCKYNPENAMLYLDDDLIEGYIHCGHLGDDGFCSLGKRKEE